MIAPGDGASDRSGESAGGFRFTARHGLSYDLGRRLLHRRSLRRPLAIGSENVGEQFADCGAHRWKSRLVVG